MNPKELKKLLKRNPILLINGKPVTATLQYSSDGKVFLNLQFLDDNKNTK